MTQVVLVAHNLRSTHNVGSLLRTAEGLGVHMVYLSGYTPYPSLPNDPRLPHLHQKLTRDIHKTALGAEATQVWEHHEDITTLMAQLKHDGYTIAALEQTPHAQALPTYAPPQKLALIVGREVEGIEPDVLAHTDLQLEIPMAGHKESFNVVQAAAMALYHCMFYDKFATKILG
jgi:tRNA G18 (ribose-2'-O)-methylase SpoU